MFLGETPIPYAAEAVGRLRNAGKHVFFLTNNSGRTRAEHCAKLARVNGLEVPPSAVFTSAYATALYLKQRGGAGPTL